jgi:hypothetical protein
MLERLENEFVCAWTLHQDLAPLAAPGRDAELARVAKRVAEAYLYPVDCQVLSPRGELLDHLDANEAMGDEGRYRRLLDAAKTEGAEPR